LGIGRNLGIFVDFLPIFLSFAFGIKRQSNKFSKKNYFIDLEAIFS
jgi:hypothetical protein